MKRSLMSSCAVAAVAAVAAVSTAQHRAAAFDTSRTYDVFIINGDQEIDTGKLHSAAFEYVDDDGHEACSYFATWDGPLGAPAPVELFFDERMTPGHADCELNSAVSFPTIIVNSPEYENSGVNKFLQGESIQNMVLAADAEGCAFGVITFDTNFPYPLVMEPSSEHAPCPLMGSTSGDQRPR